MIRIVFAGFRHPHINALYESTKKSALVDRRCIWSRLYRKESDHAQIIMPDPIEKTMIEDFVCAVKGEKNTFITTEDVLTATEWTLRIQSASEK